MAFTVIQYTMEDFDW